MTTDPAGTANPIREGAGPVTSDSLAAESSRGSSGFSKNRDAEPLAVEGSKSTFGTTDTSAATELPPAADGAGRQNVTGGEVQQAAHGSTRGDYAGPASGHSEEHQHKGEGEQQQGQQQGQKTTSGQHPSDTLRSGGGGDNAKDPVPRGSEQPARDQGDDEREIKRDDAVTNQPGVAPTYVKADVLDRVQHAKPKGKNLHEGGIEDDAPNASSMGEIGTENDPGRLAEQRFEARNAEDPRHAGPRDMKLQGEQGYEALDSERPA